MPATATRPRPSFRKQSGPARSSKQFGEPKKKAASEEHEILFQQFFKSVGPRTYVSQVKKAKNGNHYIVLTEGRRDEDTKEVRKTRLFLFSEDFVEFFRLIKATAEFVKANPVSEEVKKKQEAHWRKKQGESETAKSGPDTGAAMDKSRPSSAAPPRPPAGSTAR